MKTIKITIPSGLSEWEKCKYLVAKLQSVSQLKLGQQLSVCNDRYSTGYFIWITDYEQPVDGGKFHPVSSRKVNRKPQPSLTEMNEWLVKRIISKMKSS